MSDYGQMQRAFYASGWDEEAPDYEEWLASQTRWQAGRLEKLAEALLSVPQNSPEHSLAVELRKEVGGCREEWGIAALNDTLRKFPTLPEDLREAMRRKVAQLDADLREAELYWEDPEEDLRIQGELMAVAQLARARADQEDHYDELTEMGRGHRPFHPKSVVRGRPGLAELY